MALAVTFMVLTVKSYQLKKTLLRSSMVKAVHLSMRNQRYSLSKLAKEVKLLIFAKFNKLNLLCTICTYIRMLRLGM